MSERSGVMVIGDDARFVGQIRASRHVEINGEVDGGIVSQTLVVSEGGKFDGTLRVDTAEVHGQLRGELYVRNLLNIGQTGDVEGNVRYGQLAMAEGGVLVAELRNVPPELAGDFELIVQRGGRAVITKDDLNATDEDDTAENLTFTVTNPVNGFVARAETPDSSVETFTQADINNGKMVFVHDGSSSDVASFDVIVADDEGATAGGSRPVMVRIKS